MHPFSRKNEKVKQEVMGFWYHISSLILHICFTVLSLQPGTPWSSVHRTEYTCCDFTKTLNNWLLLKFNYRFPGEGNWIGPAWVSSLSQPAMAKGIHSAVYTLGLESPRASGSSSQGRGACVLAQDHTQHCAAVHCVSPSPTMVWGLFNLS